MWTGNMYFDRVIKSDHVNGHLKKKASLPLVSFNRCKSKVHSVDILEGLSLALFTVQWGEILFWSVSKMRSRYDPFAYFSNSFISGESMVITIELNLIFMAYRGSPTYTKITSTVSTNTVFGLCTGYLIAKWIK